MTAPGLTVVPQKPCVTTDVNSEKALNESSEDTENTIAALRRELAEALRERDGYIEMLHTARVAAAEATARAERWQRAAKALRVRKDTPTERVMRRAFNERVRALAHVHAKTTARLLNVQKRCFEEELESMDAEANATCIAFERQLELQRECLRAATDEHEREREAALAKTAVVMKGVRERLRTMEEHIRRVEGERDDAVHAARERQAVLDVIAGGTRIGGGERRRLEIVAQASGKERARKNALIEALQREIENMGRQMKVLKERNGVLVKRLSSEEDRRVDEDRQHKEDLDSCRLESKGDVDRLGRLFASVMQDFANSQQTDSLGLNVNHAKDLGLPKVEVEERS